MPPQQGYISRQFEALEDGAKTPMAICRHCNDKKVARNIVARKVAHLAACEPYSTYLQTLLDDESSNAGDKELKQLPDELKTKIEQRIEQPLLSKTSHAAAEVANQESLKSDLDDTVMQAIFHGSLPFDAFEPNKHPHILRLCRMITPDFVPPSRSRLAQAMVKLSTQPVQSVEPIEPLQTPQPSAIEIDYAQEESARAALSSRIVNDLLSRATPQSTPGSKRPFDLV
ncbi:hypothetical protein D6C90_04268 [Aureobasidium pullulans]|uniref:Uncharacterized protein n=1 Tax=Aureobasidium pullulans TaxID=5580 RepID=A0A4S9MN88_AURPU|nr:hypothetical protein D6C97_08951 [Aureobasidium pullulans]THZ46386.1 hypothetical protein D6C90_04268 [Aureobasidium pullulans]